MRRPDTPPRERRPDPRQQRREQEAAIKQEAQARQFLINHQLRNALEPRAGERLDIDTVRKLLDEGAQTEGGGFSSENQRGSALSVLIGARTDTETACAVARLLLERGADASFRYPLTGRSLMHEAAENGWNEKGLSLLVEAGASPRTGDRDGNTPLHALLTPRSEKRAAFWEKRGDLLDHLVAAWLAVGANPSARNKAGETPLDRVFLTDKPLRDHAVYRAFQAGLPWTKMASRKLRALAQQPASLGLRQALMTAAEAMIAQGQARNLAHGLDEELPEAEPVGASAPRKPRL